MLWKCQPIRIRHYTPCADESHVKSKRNNNKSVYILLLIKNPVDFITEVKSDVSHTAAADFKENRIPGFSLMPVQDLEENP